MDKRTVHRMPHSRIVNEATHTTYLPRVVRHAKNICPAAKILFSEVLYLSDENLCCVETNSLLAKLLNSDTSSIKRWLKALSEEKFLSIEHLICKERGSCRKIWINVESLIDREPKA